LFGRADRGVQRLVVGQGEETLASVGVADEGLKSLRDALDRRASLDRITGNKSRYCPVRHVVDDRIGKIRGGWTSRSFPSRSPSRHQRHHHVWRKLADGRRNIPQDRI